MIYELLLEGEESAQFVRTLRQRALHTLRAAKAAQEALTVLDGQTKCDDE